MVGLACEGGGVGVLEEAKEAEEEEGAKWLRPCPLPLRMHLHFLFREDQVDREGREDARPILGEEAAGLAA